VGAREAQILAAWGLGVEVPGVAAAVAGVVPVAGVEEAAERCEEAVVGAVGDAAEETVLGEV